MILILVVYFTSLLDAYSSSSEGLMPNKGRHVMAR